MSTPSIRDISSPQAHTPPSSSARSSSVDYVSWIDHFIDDGLAHLATSRRPSQRRWRDTRAPASLQDVEAQQPDITQPGVTIKLHPLAAAPSGMASKVDYEQGLEFTRKDKRAMILVFLAVLAFTIIIIVAMVASGQQGKDDEWLVDHTKISMIDESSLGTALHPSTISIDNEDTTHLLDTHVSSALPRTTASTKITDTVPSTSPQQPTITVETGSTTILMPSRPSLDIALTTPITLEMTISTDSTSTVTSVESAPSTEASVDTTTKVPEPITETSTDSPPLSTAQVPAMPTSGPAPNMPALPITSVPNASPSSSPITDSPPSLHSEVVTSPVNLSTGWGGSLVMSTWNTPAKTIGSTIDIVPASSPIIAVLDTTAVPMPEPSPQDSKPDRRPGEVVNSILQVIDDGHWQLGGH
nr:hypothetical protein B0A51_15906 [Rachicladosporium sp. CCFEE 5018]